MNKHKKKSKNTPNRPRREHAGGPPTTGYESISQEVVPVPVAVEMPPTPEEIDASLGLKEPGEKTENEMTDGPAALVRFVGWLLEPLAHIEKVDGKSRAIYMEPRLAAYAKTVVIQLFLRPSECGQKAPTIASLAPVVGISKQSLGRVSLDLRRAFPGFISQQMRSPEVREIYSQAHIHAQDKMDNGEQLTIGF